MNYLNLTTPYQTPNPFEYKSFEEFKQLVEKQAEIIRTFQAQAQQECKCHIIDPSKMRILLWINRHKNNKPDTCVLKIAEQRLLGLPRSDRRGETYWRFDEILTEKETPPTSFKCSSCQEEVTVIGSDNPAQEIKQRQALKKELASIEEKEVQAPVSQNTETKKEISQKEKSPRQVLKEQIAQATAENKTAQQNENAPQ